MNKIVERKKYEKEFLMTKKNKQLHKFCKPRKIPYLGLKKEEIVSNIIQWSNGASKLEDYSCKGLLDPDREPKNKNLHILDIRCRRFCFEYSTRGTLLTRMQWAKRIGVSHQTILKWLSWDEAKALIETFQKSYEDRIMQKFVDEEEEVVEQLLNVIKQRRNTDVKRKAINDFLGYRGSVNVNEKSTNISVSQSQKQAQKGGNTLIQNNISRMSDEDIQDEIKQLEEMENQNE